MGHSSRRENMEPDRGRPQAHRCGLLWAFESDPSIHRRWNSKLCLLRVRSLHPSGRSNRFLRTDSFAHLELHLAVLGIHHDVISMQHFAVEDLQRQWILNQLLDGAL